MRARLTLRVGFERCDVRGSKLPGAWAQPDHVNAHSMLHRTGQLLVPSSSAYGSRAGQAATPANELTTKHNHLARRALIVPEDWLLPRPSLLVRPDVSIVQASQTSKFTGNERSFHDEHVQ